MIESFLFHPLMMLLYGMLGHGLTLMVSMKASGNAVHPIEAIKAHPWQVSLAVIGSLVGYGILYSADQVTPVSAVAVGYMGSDVFSRITAGAGSKLERLAKQ